MLLQATLWAMKCAASGPLLPPMDTSTCTPSTAVHCTHTRLPLTQTVSTHGACKTRCRTAMLGLGFSNNCSVEIWILGGPAYC